MNNNFVCIDVATIGELVCCSLFVFQKIEFLFLFVGSIFLWLNGLFFLAEVPRQTAICWSLFKSNQMQLVLNKASLHIAFVLLRYNDNFLKHEIHSCLARVGSITHSMSCLLLTISNICKLLTTCGVSCN
jgi:hypothetical protein